MLALGSDQPIHSELGSHSQHMFCLFRTMFLSGNPDHFRQDYRGFESKAPLLAKDARNGAPLSPKKISWMIGRNSVRPFDYIVKAGNWPA